jgi:hypothetical protein
MVARIFAVFAAFFLVASVAIGALTTPGTTLGQGLTMLDKNAPNWLREHSLAWFWNWIEVPFMMRPMWLIPAGLGLICVGLATTLNLGDAAPRRRRS